jgi:hypothetical protein
MRTFAERLRWFVDTVGLPWLAGRQTLVSDRALALRLGLAQKTLENWLLARSTPRGKSPQLAAILARMGYSAGDAGRAAHWLWTGEGEPPHQPAAAADQPPAVVQAAEPIDPADYTTPRAAVEAGDTRQLARAKLTLEARSREALLKVEAGTATALERELATAWLELEKGFVQETLQKKNENGTGPAGIRTQTLRIMSYRATGVVLPRSATLVLGVLNPGDTEPRPFVPMRVPA